MKKMLIVLALCIVATNDLSFANDIHDEDLVIKVILGEARDKANRDHRVWLGISEVIRRRGVINSNVFSCLKDETLDDKIAHDRLFLLKRKKIDIVEMARRAWRESEHTNITKGATHFENANQFGEPSWSIGKVKTIILNDISFYR